MDDLISRQAVCDWLEWYGNDAVKNGYQTSIVYAWKYIRDKMPPAQQWIPCYTRMPPEDVEVLVSTPKGAVHEAYFAGYNDLGNAVWHCPAEYEFRTLWGMEVSAWMPKPEGYKPT